MRSKEEAHDYRYFPDPDLLPLELDADWIKAIEASLPELPDEKKARFIKDYGLPAYDAGVLVTERELADYYEEMARGVDAKLAANWLNNEILGRLNKEGLSIAECPVECTSQQRDPQNDHGSDNLREDRQGCCWTLSGAKAAIRQRSSRRADCVR